MKTDKQIGNELHGIVESQRDTCTWYIRVVLDDDKIAILRTRESKVINIGDEIDSWVIGWNNNENLPIVTEDEFGRLPISDRMRPRYINALKLVTKPNNINEETLLDSLSDLKGMFNRCIKKDQWDWYSVYLVLEKPLFRKLLNLVDLCIKARKELKKDKNNFNKLKEIQEIGIDFNEVQRNITSQALTIGKNLDLKRFTDFADSNEKPEQTDEYILSRFTKAKLEKANKTHQETLELVSIELEKRGYITQYNNLIDLFCMLKSGPAIFEIKSIHHKNERSQIRHAISQLYEYRYLHNINTAQLFIVLSSKPIEEWIVNYLQEDREIYVLWIEKKEIKGPGFDYML